MRRWGVRLASPSSQLAIWARWRDVWTVRLASPLGELAANWRDFLAMSRLREGGPLGQLDLARWMFVNKKVRGRQSHHGKETPIHYKINGKLVISNRNIQKVAILKYRHSLVTWESAHLVSLLVNNEKTVTTELDCSTWVVVHNRYTVSVRRLVVAN